MPRERQPQAHVKELHSMLYKSFNLSRSFQSEESLKSLARLYTQSSVYSSNLERASGKKHFADRQDPEHISNLSEMISKKSQPENLRSAKRAERNRTTCIQPLPDKVSSIRIFQENYSHETNMQQLLQRTSEDGFAYHRRLNTCPREEYDQRTRTQNSLDQRQLKNYAAHSHVRPPRNPVTGQGVAPERKEGKAIVRQQAQSKSPLSQRLFTDSTDASPNKAGPTQPGIRRVNKTYVSTIPYISSGTRQDDDKIEVNAHKQLVVSKLQGSPQIKKILGDRDTRGSRDSGDRDSGDDYRREKIYLDQQRAANKYKANRQCSDRVKTLMSDLPVSEGPQMRQLELAVKESNRLINEQRNDSYGLKKIMNFGEGFNKIKYEDYMKNLKSAPQPQHHTGRKRFAATQQHESDHLNARHGANAQAPGHPETHGNATGQPRAATHAAAHLLSAKDCSSIISKNNLSYLCHGKPAGRRY